MGSIKPDDVAADAIENGDPEEPKKKKKSIKPDDEAANELPPEEEEPKKEKKKKRSSSIKPEEAAIMEEVASDTSSKKEKKKKKKGPPSFDAELQDVLTTEGQSVKFSLTITSKPELDSIKWYKDGKKIKKDDHFVIVKDDP